MDRAFIDLEKLEDLRPCSESAEYLLKKPPARSLLVSTHPGRNYDAFTNERCVLTREFHVGMAKLGTATGSAELFCN